MKIAAIAIISFCAVVLAQQNSRPTAAVYIRDVMGDKEERDFIRDAVNDNLTKSRKYTMVAVDAIDNAIAREADRQKQQMVSTMSAEQIAQEFAQKAGAQYVCVVGRSKYRGVEYITIKMVDMTGKVADGQSDMKPLDANVNPLNLIKQMIGEMFGLGGAQSGQSGGGGSSFTDERNGKTYKTVKIGSRTWMARNLDYQTGNSWCYDNDNIYCEKYGRLYNWNTARVVCPSGWHLPSRGEWNDLVGAVGGTSIGGMKLKARNGWDDGGNGTNDYEFAALPGGGRYYSGGSFGYVGKDGFWWTAAESDGGSAYYRYMFYGGDEVLEGSFNKGSGFSVRCVRD
jgi:uncharacterized protein (TIGR02145 family)